MVLQTKTSKISLARVLAILVVRGVAKGEERRTRMTSQQIEYAKLLESRRHNQESESVERAKAGTQQQTAYVNDQHFQRQDAINWFSALQSAQAAGRQAEAAISRAETEAAKLPIEMVKAEASKLQANASVMNANTQKGALAETITHNRNVEAQTDLSLAQDFILGKSKIDETKAHNIATEKEDRRHNIQSERNQLQGLANDLILGQDRNNIERAKALMEYDQAPFNAIGSILSGLGSTIGGASRFLTSWNSPSSSKNPPNTTNNSRSGGNR